MAQSVEEYFGELARLGREDYGSYLFVRSPDVGSVLAYYGVDPGLLEEKRVADLFWSEEGPRVLVSVMPTGGSAWVAVGEHGVDLVGLRVLKVVSAGTKAVLLGYSTGLPRIRVAVGGELLRVLDPAGGNYDPAEALAEESGLAFGGLDGQISTFMLIERLTGLRMTRQWLLGPNPTAIAAPRPAR